MRVLPLVDFLLCRVRRRSDRGFGGNNGSSSSGGSCDHGVLKVLVQYLWVDRHRETRSGVGAGLGYQTQQ